MRNAKAMTIFRKTTYYFINKLPVILLILITFIYG